MKITKSERLSLRLDEITKCKIEKAAAVTQSSLNSFILTTVLAKADEIIQHHETMILSDRDQEIFFNALLNPPEANNELKNALIDHDKMVDSDV